MVKIIRLYKDNFQSGKISVKFSKLYGEKKLSEISLLSFDEILKFLEENDFKKAVDSSFLSSKGFYLIERILNVHLSRIYNEIFNSSSKKNKILLDSYYLKYQIHNLMVLIRCKLSDEKEFESFLIGDDRKKKKFIKAFKMPNLTDSIVYISKKIGFDSNDVLKEYKRGIYFLENYLYKKYYENLSRFRFSFNGNDERFFLKYIREYIDLLNSRTFLRLNLEKIDLDFKEVFMEGGNLDFNFFKNLKGKSIKNILEVFNKEHGDIEICEDNLCIASLDKRINKHKKSSKNLFGSILFGSPFYALKYLFELEFEMSKLRILLKTKYLDLNEKEAKDLI